MRMYHRVVLKVEAIYTGRPVLQAEKGCITRDTLTYKTDRPDILSEHVIGGEKVNQGCNLVRAVFQSRRMCNPRFKYEHR